MSTNQKTTRRSTIRAHRTENRSTQPQSFFSRTRELGRLLPLWPHEIEDVSLEGRRTLVNRLERALRAERNRGRSGHWAYDLARHVQLHSVWQRERKDLDALERAHKTKAARR